MVVSLMMDPTMEALTAARIPLGHLTNMGSKWGQGKARASRASARSARKRGDTKDTKEAKDTKTSRPTSLCSLRPFVFFVSRLLRAPAARRALG
ncbi:MAG: hypothetical protein CMJ17_04840 [Phenylobacterium sp.]|nr:hypothetical protein [Phenylobacterium sp.]